MNIAKKLIVTLGIMCIILGAMYSVSAADELITVDDQKDDVFTIDALSGAEEYNFTSEKPNIDIKKITYDHGEGTTQVILTFEVYGQIENRGSLPDDITDITDALDSVTYEVVISTSGGLYTINYGNQKCRITYPNDTKQNITGYTVNGGTLQIPFDLTKPDETYDEMFAETYDIKLDLTAEDYFMYVDFAYEILEIAVDAGGPYEAEIGESISFQGEAGYIIPEPIENFDFSWNFGDGTTSTIQNPTHNYNEAGNYTVTLTVTDESGSMANATAEVTIIGGSSGNGQPNGQSDAGLLLFVAIIAIIVIIGIVVLVLIIRR